VTIPPAPTHERPKALAVASQKGGVGKTTLSLNLALAFAEGGYRVLLIDTDPQGAIGLSLSKKLTERPGLVDCIAGEAELETSIVRTSLTNLLLLPLGQLAPSETQAFGSAMADGSRFGALLTEASHHCDLALIDTPCGFGGITLGVLRNATHVVSPIQAEPIALRSVDQLLEMVQSLKRQGAPLKIAGLVISMLQRDDERSVASARDVWDLFPPQLLFDASIPRDPVFLEATAVGVPVGMLRTPRPAVTHIFELLAAELALRMQLPTAQPNDGPQALVD